MSTAKRYHKNKPKASKQARAKKNAKKRELAEFRRRAGGQPEKYDPSFAEEAERLCRLGATDAELADHFGVTTVTLWNWANRHQEFFKSIRVGKDAADDRVERSLYESAIGTTYVTEKVYFKGKKPVVVKVHEKLPPSDRAQRFWLTNRKRHEWKERQETGFDPDQPLKIIVEGGLPK